MTTMTMNRILKACTLILLLGLLAPVGAHAQYERPGSAGAQFLKIGVSPRAAALGDAYVALADGAEAAYYNPAALAWLPGTAAAFNHTRLFAGINHDFAAVSHTVDGLGSVALSMTGFYTDAMKERTPLQPDGTGAEFRTIDYRLGLSVARRLTDRVAFGVTGAYVGLQPHPDYSTGAVSLDIATLFRTGYRGFNFGMMISNFGSNIRFVSEDYPLPTNFTFGASAHAVEREEMTLTVSGQAVKPNDGKPLAQLGAEWSYRDVLSLRGGYRPGHDAASFSLGGGLAFSLAGLDMQLDYAYSDFSVLGEVHRFGVDLRL